MRYSAIIGKAFYRIELPTQIIDMVDVFFTASAHHFLLITDCANIQDRKFHLKRHRLHLKAMMNLIYQHGDFRNAIDQSFRGLDIRESWNPDFNFLLPDPRMFNSMNRDPSCGIGEPHPSDRYINLTDLLVLPVPTRYSS